MDREREKERGREKGSVCVGDEGNREIEKVES